LVTVDLGNLTDQLAVRELELEEPQPVGVADLQVDPHLVDAALRRRQRELEAVLVAGQVPRAGHGQEAVTAKLLQDRPGYFVPAGFGLHLGCLLGGRCLYCPKYTPRRTVIGDKTVESRVEFQPGATSASGWALDRRDTALAP